MADPQLPHVFTQGTLMKSVGPILQSYRAHPVTEERMVYFEAKVGNGFEVPKPLPYGVFAEVSNLGNSRESLLQVWVADGYYQNNVSFFKGIEKVFNYDRFIKKANVEQQIVLGSQPLITDADTWEATIPPLDETHGLSRRVQVVETNPVRVGEWDELFNKSRDVTQELVKASVAEQASDFPSALVQDGGVYNWVQYEEVRCGWYVKNTLPMTNQESVIFGTTRNYFWPAVLQSIDLGILNGEEPNGEQYIASVLIDARYKESYNGPSAAQITRKWTATEPPLTNPVGLMFPDAFQYKGIFFNFSSPEALHPTVNFNEQVGTRHPTLASNQFRNKSFPGTAQTDWSSFVQFVEEPQTHNGGWVQDTVKIFAPS